jgi:hypothetical protein
MDRRIAVLPLAYQKETNPPMSGLCLAYPDGLILINDKNLALRLAEKHAKQLKKASDFNSGLFYGFGGSAHRSHSDPKKFKYFWSLFKGDQENKLMEVVD